MKPNAILISGQPGAGSSTTARILAKKLNLNYFSPGQMWKDIGRGKIKERAYYPVFKKICSNKGIEIPEFNEATDSHAVTKLWSEIGKTSSFNEATDELQSQLAKEKNIILDGKLSLRMIKEPSLKIWLKASIGDRAKRTANRDRLDLQKSIEILGEREKTEREHWKKIYGFDYFDQEKDADLIINTSDLSPGLIADQIINRLTNNL